MVDVEQPWEVLEELAERLPDEAVARLHRWWVSLPADERRGLATSWNEERSGPRETNEVLTVLLEPRFIDATDREVEEDRAELRTARQALLEWVSGHPEYRWGLAHRSFHICRAHAQAREVVRTGTLHAGFRCPLGRAACPMRRVLDERPGHHVELSVVGLRRSRASAHRA